MSTDLELLSFYQEANLTVGPTDDPLAPWFFIVTAEEDAVDHPVYLSDRSVRTLIRYLQSGLDLQEEGTA